MRWQVCMIVSVACRRSCGRGVTWRCLHACRTLDWGSEEAVGSALGLERMYTGSVICYACCACCACVHQEGVAGVQGLPS